MTDPVPVELECFELVLLRRPAGHAPVTDEEAARLHRLHLAHLTRMREEGHLVVAGPFDEQADETLRGLCLYRTGSVERATELASEDPAVQAGRFTLEVMRFWCPKGGIGGGSDARPAAQ
jgi:uncharacterized protein YciI